MFQQLQVKTFLNNPELERLGISEETYSQFPLEKKELYADIHIMDSASDTKYFKVEQLSTPNNINEDSETIVPEVLVEISEQEYEVVKERIESGNKDESRLVNPDEESGTWYKMTTEVLYVDNSGGLKRYSLVNKVEIITNELDQVGGTTSHKAYIAGGLNSLCSPISGSEVMTKWQTNTLTGQTDRFDEFTAPFKNQGYGFDFGISAFSTKCDVTMTFLFTTLQDINIIDAYGFCGYWDRAFTGSVGIDIGMEINGPSISITPTTYLVKANDTHAQMLPA